MPPLLLYYTTINTSAAVPTSAVDLLLLLRPLISSRRMGLTTPPAARLRTRPARCCSGQAQFAYEYSLKGRTQSVLYGPAMCTYTRCRISCCSSTNSGRTPTAPARESFVCVGAFPEPTRTGIGAVCALSAVGIRGRKQCRITHDDTVTQQ